MHQHACVWLFENGPGRACVKTRPPPPHVFFTLGGGCAGRRCVLVAALGAQNALAGDSQATSIVGAHRLNKQLRARVAVSCSGMGVAAAPQWPPTRLSYTARSRHCQMSNCNTVLRPRVLSCFVCCCCGKRAVPFREQLSCSQPHFGHPLCCLRGL